MATPSQVGAAGDRLVTSDLRRKGYRVRPHASASGYTPLEAQAHPARIVVQVKAAEYPEEPPYLSRVEEATIKAMASEMSAEAWEARVQVDDRLRLTRSIGWRKLK
jgi:hypothetical protein